MLKAIHFISMLDFVLHKDSKEHLLKLGQLIESVFPNLLFDEMLKLFQCGYGEKTFSVLRGHNIFKKIFLKQKI